MSNFKTRLIAEEEGLKSNIEKLYNFTQSEPFDKVDDAQKPLLRIQLQAMGTYRGCLIERINAL